MLLSQRLVEPTTGQRRPGATDAGGLAVRALLAGVLVLVTGPAVMTARAEPVLQLDVLDGTYDTTEQTIIAPGAAFTLYTLLTPKASRNAAELLSETYYLSVAVTPRLTPPGASLGSFSIQGPIDSSQPYAGCLANVPCNVRVTEDMIYGNPPFETYTGEHGHDAGDLSPHGIYETYYIEFGFQFDPTKRTFVHDTATQPGLAPTGTGGAYYQAFQVDTSNLNRRYQIHFDLYSTLLKNRTGDLDVDTFAPFSHDAQSALLPEDVLLPASEPTSLLLVATALIGLRWRIRRTGHRPARWEVPGS